MKIISNIKRAKDEQGKYIIDNDWYDYLMKEVASYIYYADFYPDCIVALARGGLKYGDMLSRVFKVPMCIMATSSYDLDKKQGDLFVSDITTNKPGYPKGKVLVVDDLVDSGITLEAVINELKKKPEIAQVKSTVLFYKSYSKIKPDWVGEQVQEDAWIHQPFEDWDEKDIFMGTKIARNKPKDLEINALNGDMAVWLDEDEKTNKVCIALRSSEIDEADPTYPQDCCVYLNAQEAQKLIDGLKDFIEACHKVESM